MHEHTFKSMLIYIFFIKFTLFLKYSDRKNYGTKMQFLFLNFILIS